MQNSKQHDDKNKARVLRINPIGSYSSFDLVKIAKNIEENGFFRPEVKLITKMFISKGMYRTCRNFLISFRESQSFSDKEKLSLDRMIELLGDLEKQKEQMQKNATQDER